MKAAYWITFKLLQLKSKLFKKKLQYLAKDYFIYHDNVIKIEGFKVIKCFSYKNTVMFLTGAKFLINNTTVIDIEDGIEIIYHGVDLRKNSIGFIIDDKQYNKYLELMDDGDVYAILYSLLVTKIKVKRGYIHKVFNIDGEVLHQFPVSRDKLTLDKEDDFIKFGLGRLNKKIHIGGFKNIIEEYNEKG